MERKLQQLRQSGKEDAGGTEPATAMAAWLGGSLWSGSCNSYGNLARRFLVERKLQQVRHPGQGVPSGAETAAPTAARSAFP